MRGYLEDRMIALKESYKKAEEGQCKLLIDARYDEVCKMYDYWESLVRGTIIDLSYNAYTIDGKSGNSCSR